MKINFQKSPLFSNHILSGSTLRNILRLLRDNNWNIKSKYIPKLLIAIFTLLFHQPFYLIEKLFFTRKIAKTKIKPPVFILGYTRSGTTYLHYLLAKDRQFGFCKFYECMSPHAMFTFGKIMRKIAQKVLPQKRPMDNLALGADLPKEEEFAMANLGIESMVSALFFPQQFSAYFNRFVLFQGDKREEANWKKNFLWLLKKLTLKNEGKPLLLKSPFHTGRLKVIKELFPDAKFIFLHRHPLKMYASNERLYEAVLPELAFQEVRNETMENHIFYTYKALMENYFEERKSLPENQLVEISYEAFFANQEEALRKIYQQLELGDFKKVWPIFEKEITEYKNYKTNEYRLSNALEKRVEKDWAFAFEAFNYLK